ncbi:MAG: UxaA family hydrolase [Deltaproteobacteria bacterium]|nr:UxaA family hydrolase [Deltaproteobacteria bacterium]
MDGNAFLINPLDNVVVVLKKIKEGIRVNWTSEGGIEARTDIPRNHKMAIKKISENKPIVKYGEKIGLAREPIHPGDWVHVHNIKVEEG